MSIDVNNTYYYSDSSTYYSTNNTDYASDSSTTDNNTTPDYGDFSTTAWYGAPSTKKAEEQEVATGTNDIVQGEKQANKQARNVANEGSSN